MYNSACFVGLLNTFMYIELSKLIILSYKTFNVVLLKAKYMNTTTIIKKIPYWILISIILISCSGTPIDPAKSDNLLIINERYLYNHNSRVTPMTMERIVLKYFITTSILMELILRHLKFLKNSGNTAQIQNMFIIRTIHSRVFHQRILNVNLNLNMSGLMVRAESTILEVR